MRVFGFKRRAYSCIMISPCSLTGIDRITAPTLLSHHLPRNDVGMMLQYRKEDLISWLQEFCTEGVRDQIDGLGRAPYKNDLLTRPCPKEVSHFIAGLLVGVGRTCG